MAKPLIYKAGRWAYRQWNGNCLISRKQASCELSKIRLRDNDVANQQQPGDSAARPAPLSPTGAARRRFARAGATASGVLLTLQSAPAMAQVICTAPSGSLSNGPTSTQPGVGTATCQGV